MSQKTLPNIPRTFVWGDPASQPKIGQYYLHVMPDGLRTKSIEVVLLPTGIDRSQAYDYFFDAVAALRAKYPRRSTKMRVDLALHSDTLRTVGGSGEKIRRVNIANWSVETNRNLPEVSGPETYYDMWLFSVMDSTLPTMLRIRKAHKPLPIR